MNDENIEISGLSTKLMLLYIDEKKDRFLIDSTLMVSRFSPYCCCNLSYRALTLLKRTFVFDRRIFNVGVIEIYPHAFSSILI